jgi:hypothetical protein
LALSGPIASNPLDVCGVVVATCIGMPRKDKYRIYAKLLQLILVEEEKPHPALY